MSGGHQRAGPDAAFTSKRTMRPSTQRSLRFIRPSFGLSTDRRAGVATRSSRTLYIRHREGADGRALPSASPSGRWRPATAPLPTATRSTSSRFPPQQGCGRRDGGYIGKGYEPVGPMPRRRNPQRTTGRGHPLLHEPHCHRGQIARLGEVDQGQCSRRAPAQPSPPGRGLRRQHLRSTRKELAGRFYQFLAAHANIGSYLHKVGRIVSQALRSRREGEDGRKVDREGGGRAGPALRVFLFSCPPLRTWCVPLRVFFSCLSFRLFLC